MKQINLAINASAFLLSAVSFKVFPDFSVDKPDFLMLTEFVRCQ